MNCEFSLFLKVRSAAELKAAAMVHNDAQGMPPEDFEHDDGSVDVTACLRMLLDPGNIPGCEVMDSAIEST